MKAKPDKGLLMNSIDRISSLRSSALTGLLLLALSGCATTGTQTDPIEGFNRAMFTINDGIDTVLIRPVAVAYDAVLPNPVRKGVTNFFGNIADVLIGVNNVLQGKLSDGVSDLSRVLVNSTVGILGILDVASDIGMEKHDEDFGQTFGRWGVDSGAYVVLPVLGPSTARDTVGLVLDMKADPVSNLDDRAVRNSLSVLQIINGRANYLAGDRVVEAAALDKYSYVRDAYLQSRRSLIYDGSPPRKREELSDALDADQGRSMTATDPNDITISTASTDKVKSGSAR